MANLYTGSINTNGEYQNLSILTGVTFTEGTTYAIQIQNTAWLREGTNGQGFIFNRDKGYSWTCKGDDLYIRTALADAIINIAEDSGFFLNKSGGGGGTTEGANKSLSNLNNEGFARFQYAPFSINNGTVINGENATLTLENNIITCAPCTITTADGRSKTFTDSATLDVSNVADGNYGVMKSYTDGSLSLSNLVISNIEPLNSATGNLWLDTSQAPLTLKQYDGSDWQVNNDLIRIGELTLGITENFTLHGNPIITSDFIYNGVANSWLIPDKNIELSNADNWEFQTRWTYTKNTDRDYLLNSATTNYYEAPSLYIATGSSVCEVELGSSGAGFDITGGAVSTNFQPVLGNTYDIIFGFDGTKYYFKYKLVTDDEHIQSWVLNSTIKCTSTGGISIGNCPGYGPNVNYATGLHLPYTNFIINKTYEWHAINTGSVLENMYFNACPAKHELVAMGKDALNATYYFVYSDGRYEQGGHYTGAIAADGSVTINLPKKVTNKNYYIYHQVYGSVSGNEGPALVVMSKGTDSFTMGNEGYQGVMTGFDWEIKGYIF